MSDYLNLVLEDIDEEIVTIESNLHAFSTNFLASAKFDGDSRNIHVKAILMHLLFVVDN